MVARPPTPVRDVPVYDEGDDDEVFRSLDYGLIYRLIALVEKDSQTRARLRLMAWTGWPHAIMMRLRPEDVDAKQRRVYVRRRRKGKGMKGRWLPLLPPAWTALEEFMRLECWGTFSQPSMRKSLLRAAEKLTAHRRQLHPGAPPIVVTPYHLRHSFGTLVALIVKDERALEELLMTEKIRRYTEAATSPRLSGAIATLGQPLEREGALGTLRQAVEAGREAATPPAVAAGNFGNFSDRNRRKPRE
jgi:integrase